MPNTELLAVLDAARSACDAKTPHMRYTRIQRLTDALREYDKARAPTPLYGFECAG